MRKGKESLEKDAKAMYKPSLDVIHSMSVYISLEIIGLMATLPRRRLGKWCRWIFATEEGKN